MVSQMHRIVLYIFTDVSMVGMMRFADVSTMESYALISAWDAPQDFGDMHLAVGRVVVESIRGAS